MSLIVSGPLFSTIHILVASTGHLIPATHPIFELKISTDHCEKIMRFTVLNPTCEYFLGVLSVIRMQC